MLPRQTIELSDLDKIHMNHRGLLKKHFCKKNLNICSETAKIVNFHFSHYVNGNYNLPYQPEFLSDCNKKQYYSFPLPIDAMCEIIKNRLHDFRGDVV